METLSVATIFWALDEVPFLDLSRLIRMKLGAGRPQDLADVDGLRSLHPGEWADPAE